MTNAITLKQHMGTKQFYDSVKWAFKNTNYCTSIQGAVNYLYWAKYNNNI